MILHIYAGRLEVGPFCGTARQCERIARQVQQRVPCTPVLSRERDYTPSQLAVLHALADDQEQRFLADLEAGRVPEPV